MKHLGVMIDCSRNAVRRPETIKKFAELISGLGFNTLMLYTEDTYEIDDPYFGCLRGRYSKEELRDIDSCCAGLGIELIPCIQTLAHLNAVVRWRKYEDITDCGDILLVGEEKTYELIQKMLDSISETFTSKKVHIGMDEAWMLGSGKYLRKNGYKPQAEIMKEHAARVAAMAEASGLEPMMWSDMFFHGATGTYYTDNPDVLDKNIGDEIPANITPVYWDYYSLCKEHYDVMIKAHKSFGRPFWFAGGLWTWTGFAPHNRYSMKASAAALESCAENNIENVFFAVWGDDGAETSLFSILPSLYYVSRFACGEKDMGKIKSGFEKLTGIPFDDFLTVDIPGVTDSQYNREAIVNPDKYTLYNDCFLGIFDSIIRRENTAAYNEAARGLSKHTGNKEYGYIFKTIQALCKVLAVKNELGINIREAYRAGNKARLAELAAECGKAGKLAEDFLKALRFQWYKENKAFGFEIQETRIGGLIARLKSCAERLELYAAGEIADIEELDEDIPDPECTPQKGIREIWSVPWSKYFAGVI